MSQPQAQTLAAQAPASSATASKPTAGTAVAPSADFEYSTQSYTGYEPTSMRAIRARYNPYVQARARVDQLRRLGHPVDKVEFILMGGTFMSLPMDYRDYFIRNLHDALSGHTSSTGAWGGASCGASYPSQRVGVAAQCGTRCLPGLSPQSPRPCASRSSPAPSASG